MGTSIDFFLSVQLETQCKMREKHKEARKGAKKKSTLH